MGRDASYDPVQPESSISEEESLVLRSLTECGTRKGEELLDSVLERGLPNGPSLLRKLVDKGLLSAETDEETPHDLTDLQIYDTPFRLAKEPSQPGRPSAPTVFSVDTVDSDPTDSFSMGVGEAYANVARIVAELPGLKTPLLDKGNPSLEGFLQLRQETFPERRETGPQQDWFDDSLLFCVIYVQALIEEGTLLERSSRMDVLPDKLELFRLSPMDAMRRLYSAFLDSEKDWDYVLAMGKSPQRPHADLRVPSPRARRLARRFLSSVLPRLPQERWIGVEGLIEWIYGQHRDIFGRESSSLHASLKRRRTWDHSEGLYLRWLLWIAMPCFGALDRGAVQHPDMPTVRVSSSSEELLRPPSEDPFPASKPFICQPTMEILAMTDRATPGDLMSLGTMADKIRTDVASLYSLTEESFHRYLLAGGRAESAVSFLKERSSQPLPQNLVSALQDWESRFGRVLIYPRVSLLEFEDAEAREQFLQQRPSPSWKEAGERFAVVLSGSAEENASLISGSSLIDYDKPLPAVFLQKSEHVLEIQLSYADLFAVPQAALFAELARKTDEVAIFEITPASVKNCPLDAARIVSILENRLADRLGSGLPLRIKAWRGELHSLRMEQCILLQVEDEGTLHGLLKLPHLKDIAVGTLGQRLLVVDPHRLKELERVLDSHHIDVQKGLRLHRFAREPMKRKVAKEETRSGPPPGTLKLSTQGTRKLLQGAISEGREVEIWVVESEGGPPRRRLIKPKSIRYKGHTPLVTCMLVGEAVERTYRIGHIKGLRMVSRRAR